MTSPPNQRTRPEITSIAPSRSTPLRHYAVLGPADGLGGERCSWRASRRERSSAAHIVTSPSGRTASISSLPAPGNVRANFDLAGHRSVGLGKVGFGSRPAVRYVGQGRMRPGPFARFRPLAAFRYGRAAAVEQMPALDVAPDQSRRRVLAMARREATPVTAPGADLVPARPPRASERSPSVREACKRECQQATAVIV